MKTGIFQIFGRFMKISSKYTPFIISIVLIVTFYFFFKERTSNQASQFSYYILKSELELEDTESLSSSIVKFKRYMTTLNFFKGFAIYDSRGQLLDYDGEIPSGNYEQRGLNTVSPFQYLVVFDSKKTRGYPIVVKAFFFDKEAFLDFLMISMFLVFFMLYTSISSTLELHRTISRIFKSLEELMHDLKGPFSLSRKVVEAVESRNFDNALSLASSAHKSIDYAFNLYRHLDHREQNELKNVSQIVLLTVINDCLISLQPETGSKKIEITATKESQIQGDMIKIQRVLHNLIQNAVRHSKSKIGVKVSESKNTIIIDVINDGDSISHDRIRRIFKPFESTTGSGLGLYIAEKFVKIHGGKIVASSNENETKFSVMLPKKLTDFKMVKVHTDTPKDIQLTSNFRVAVVEDDTFIQQNIVKSLKYDLVSVSVFSTVDEFLIAVSSGSNYEVAIIDRYGLNYDAIEKRVGIILKEELNFKGKTILYSNSELINPRQHGFDKSFSKEKDLTLEDLIN